MATDRSDVEKTQRQNIHVVAASSSISDDHPSTLAAPSFASPAPPWMQKPFQPGDKVADYELIKPLGKGGFATVFLAKQLSLGRQVALKISPNRGHEAQTLASLEHDHIIQVFSETILENRQTRLLCMQYVAGTTLAEVMGNLTPEIRCNSTGCHFLNALDQVSSSTEEFRPTAMQERQQLSQANFFEVVCWLGAKLCSALEFAHRSGVLHRDIKPANILINSYGRPFLADFNLATQADSQEKTPVGGTLPYMSPEQLRAFSSRQAEAWKLVDERSDLYSLGVVLHELATGYRPYTTTPGGDGPSSEGMAILLRDDFDEIPSLKQWNPAIPDCLDWIIRKCLAPEPDERFTSAAEMRQALESCRTHVKSLAQLPTPPSWTGYFHRHPFISLLMVSTVTNVLATAVNWSYNMIQIISDFTIAQKLAFQWVVIVYNLLAFPILVGFTAYLIYRRYQEWQALSDGHLVTEQEVVQLRQRLNFLATWSIMGSLSGWLPGGIIFPLAIHWGGAPLTTEQFLHFALSFTLSGLIAITYCYLGSQYIVLRVLLPRLCMTRSDEDDVLAVELRRVPFRLLFFQAMAGVIPLTGALLLVMIGSTHPGDGAFRVLVSVLIIFGMLGFVIALQITQYLQRVLQCLLRKSR